VPPPRSLWGQSSIVARLSEFFAPGVVTRGEGYLERVDVEVRSAQRLVARVRGTSPYRVILGVHEGRVSGKCSCPYCSVGDPCKHLWATLRVAERLRWFAPDAVLRSFRVDLELSLAPAAANVAEAEPPASARAKPGAALATEEGTRLGVGMPVDRAVAPLTSSAPAEAGVAGEDDYEDDLDADWQEDDGTDSDADLDLDDEDLLPDPDTELISSPPSGPAWPKLQATRAALAPSWQRVLHEAVVGEGLVARGPEARTRLHYLLVPEELSNNLLYVHFGLPAAAATLGAPRGRRGESAVVAAAAVPDDFTQFVLPNERARRLEEDALPVERWLAALAYSGPHTYTGQAMAVRLDGTLFPRAVRELCATGRCHLARRTAQVAPVEFFGRTEPLRWDEDVEPWRLEFELVAVAEAGGNHADSDAFGRAEPRAEPEASFEVMGRFIKGQQTRALSDAEVLIGSGLVLWPNLAARFDAEGAFALAAGLRLNLSGMRVREADLEEFVQRYHGLHAPPQLALPKAFELTPLLLVPVPCLDIRRPEPGKSGVPAQVTFAYAERHVALGTPGARVVDWAARQLLLRDMQTEQRAVEQLALLGVRSARGGPLKPYEQRGLVSLAAKRIPNVVRALLEQGWSVEAAGKPYRKAGRFALRVTTGLDWLELSADLEFAGRAIALPELLAALKSGETSLVLDDGSVGILPEEWLERWGVLRGLGERSEDRLRFQKSELPLLSALVDQAPDLDADAAFVELQRELERGVRPEDGEPPVTLVGELRHYQRDGLAFLRYLERTGFGGCLADDMGLGKTVQLLAHLATPRTPSKPSLVVAPRSVLFNWERETSRFAPGLRVLTHFGADREPPGAHFEAYDLVLTTYALLRLDRAAFAAQSFRFVVLDEAQAIKNAESHTARAARGLRAEHRLALSGTPLENHIGELWSLFEFLNPGLLQHSKRLKQALTKARTFDTSSAALLAKAVRPFLLRRTKLEVAPELPERTEQTLYVELSPEERRSYNELSVYYRAVIRDKIETLGVERSTPQVLEALLRLRQAACHPGLLDETRVGEGSAKLDLLLARLAEVVEGGHKALVFSQFTSLLAILRAQLDEQGIVYEYLDGKTTRREERVDRFQNDPNVQLFLVSLKAGGVGLNLTAADYVFILDPWWNPAAEAQAIDRAHRIGQTRRVVAYRLIARDTVEEKVEALQGKKRELVAAVLGDGKSLGRGLNREDLDALLA
jgi:superfamily II DNA or RNA helicase